MLLTLLLSSHSIMCSAAVVTESFSVHSAVSYNCNCWLQSLFGVDSDFEKADIISLSVFSWL